jgi:hypothetical protein
MSFIERNASFHPTLRTDPAPEESELPPGGVHPVTTSAIAATPAIVVKRFFTFTPVCEK